MYKKELGYGVYVVRSSGTLGGERRDGVEDMC